MADGAPMRRRFLVPEVIQTSAMDCGPAALKALFGGFGVYLSYDNARLDHAISMLRSLRYLVTLIAWTAG